MQLVKRIEIIVSSREMPKILNKLDEVAVPGYSVLRDVIGKGDWGQVSDDFDLAGTTLSNVYILSFCQPEQVEKVLHGIIPLLNKLGGVCFVSDAMAVKSMKGDAKVSD